MSSINYVSKETLERLKKELNILKTARSEIAKAISEAREKGDLKENAEYDAAKEAQGLHEAKISELENSIINSRIIDSSQIDSTRVSILTTVTIKNLNLDKSFTYKIVSESEANLKENKLSVSSPIASGILGKEIGEIVDVKTPNGIIKLKIENITL